MYIHRLATSLFKNQQKLYVNNIPRRNVQITVVGAASDIGANVAAMLKQNPKIKRLKLYDEEDRVKGIALELSHIPGGPVVTAYAGEGHLASAIDGANLILMVARTPRKPGCLREQMLGTNAPAVQRLCKAIIERNSDAFIGISTNPVNSIIPFVSAFLYNHSCYNPFKLFGITHIDTARSRAFAGAALHVDPKSLQVPVIGGHSADTVVPLFSNLTPSNLVVSSWQADMLTRLVKKAGSEIVHHKKGYGSANMAMAWSINEFVEAVVHALNGGEAHVNCFTANPNFGTRFFAGPLEIGPFGITQTCTQFDMSNFELKVLSDAVTAINRDVSLGENYTQVLGTS